MSIKKSNYRDLIVWQRAISLVPDVYALLRTFPIEERYALADQIRRSAVSVPANIAEGQGRNHPKEFLQFLGIAKGSLAELETLMIIAQKLDYVTNEQLATLEVDFQKIRQPLSGLMNSLKR